MGQVRDSASRIRVAAPAAVVVLLLSICGCTAPVRDHLSAPTPHGNIKLFTNVTGRGGKNVGTYSAGGTVSISGSCIGKGNATVTVPPTGEKFGIVCVPVGRGGAIIGTVDFTVTTTTVFRVRVSAPAGTRWILGGAASSR
jgi:hypothetical protein